MAAFLIGPVSPRAGKPRLGLRPCSLSAHAARRIERSAWHVALRSRPLRPGKRRCDVSLSRVSGGMQSKLNRSALARANMPSLFPSSPRTSKSASSRASPSEASWPADKLELVSSPRDRPRDLPPAAELDGRAAGSSGVPSAFNWISTRLDSSASTRSTRRELPRPRSPPR